jgi:hypothetical protein
LFEGHTGLRQKIVIERTSALRLQTLAARLHQWVVRRRKRQLVDDDRLQCIARHVKTFPKTGGGDQHRAFATRLDGLPKTLHQLAFRVLPLNQYVHLWVVIR